MVAGSPGSRTPACWGLEVGGALSYSPVVQGARRPRTALHCAAALA